MTIQFDYYGIQLTVSGTFTAGHKYKPYDRHGDPNPPDDPDEFEIDEIGIESENDSIDFTPIADKYEMWSDLEEYCLEKGREV